MSVLASRLITQDMVDTIKKYILYTIIEDSEKIVTNVEKRNQET